mmetsp:Transcript_28760/g.51683  ORF Transcript_28760/g.51683 Transcript_28760/m.51683 type:complete len:209 (+) Transcript_28760:473-1099(+)
MAVITGFGRPPIIICWYMAAICCCICCTAARPPAPATISGEGLSFFCFEAPSLRLRARFLPRADAWAAVNSAEYSISSLGEGPRGALGFRAAGRILVLLLTGEADIWVRLAQLVLGVTVKKGAMGFPITPFIMGFMVPMDPAGVLPAPAVPTEKAVSDELGSCIGVEEVIAAIRGMSNSPWAVNCLVKLSTSKVISMLQILCWLVNRQ